MWSGTSTKAGTSRFPSLEFGPSFCYHLTMPVGSEYDRLLADFIAMGGDLSLCPFDADGYVYEGPRMEGGEIVPG